MRSGLQNVGIIPLLAVVVAALLSLTPMFLEAWGKSPLAWSLASPVSVENSGPGLMVGVQPRQEGTARYLRDGVCDISNHSLRLTVPSDVPVLKKTTRYLSSLLRETWKRASQSGLIPLRSPGTTTTPAVNLVTEQRQVSVNSLLPITQPPQQSGKSCGSSPTTVSLDVLSISPEHTPGEITTVVEAKSAGPAVDGRSSFLAILVSLIVAIAWF